MWNKIKRITSMIFYRYCRYSHYVAGAAYVLAAIHEYWMGEFDLFQFMIYGISPIIIFSAFYLQGIMRGKEKADFDILTQGFKDFHEHIMRQIFQKNNEIDGQSRAIENKPPEIH